MTLWNGKKYLLCYKALRPASVMIRVGITSKGRILLCFFDQEVKVILKINLEHVLQGILQPKATNHIDETL